MKTKSTLLQSLFLSLFAIQMTNAQLNFDWVAQIGGTGSDEGRSMACDAAGNIFSTGVFQGTTDFDPGAGTFNLTTASFGNVYVQKLNASGDLEWAIQFGGTGYDSGLGITVDPGGNALVTGYFEGTVDFDPGPGTSVLTSNGSIDAFIVKLDQNGNLLWAKILGGSSAENGRSICTDASGNVYATGYFSGTADLDPGAGVSMHTSAGQTDIYLLKLDPNGNTLWARQFGGTSGDVGSAVCVDNNGNPVLTGYFQGTVDFDPGAGNFMLTSNSGQGIYVLKLNGNGDFLWANSIVGSGPAYGLGVCTDPLGNAIVIGTFYGTADFDPGPGVLNMTSNGSDDIFLQKFDPAGASIWAKQLGGAYSDYGFSVTTDAAGNVYATGIFDATVDFDPGPGSFPISTNGFNDLYILQLLSNGDFGWAQQIGGGDADAGYCVVMDNNDNLLVNGYFYFTVDFDTGAGVNNLVSNGSTDAFVLKLANCTPSSGTDNQVICGSSYSWIDGNTYNQATNSPSWTLTNAAGCDSVVTLNLSFLAPSSGTDVIVSCIPITWIDGNIYSTDNNTATWTLTAANGCDSLVTLDFTLSPYSYAGDDVITACNQYTWIDGITYYASNNSATMSYTSVEGCDSTIYLDLTINYIDVSVSQNGAQLTANNPNAQYQWISCPSNAPISGATSQVFNVLSNGSYACILNDGACIDTSACITVNNLGQPEISDSDFRVYPNPVEDVLNLPEIPDFVRASVYSCKGEILLDSESPIFPVSHLSPGYYFIEIVSSDSVLQSRFVKK